MNMDDRRWDKLAAGTGVAFVALIVGSNFVVPKAPPKIDDPIAKVGQYYAAHHSGLLWGGWLGLLGALFGLWFIGTVAHWVRRQNQPRLATIAFGGGVTATGLALAGGLMGTGLAYLVTAPDDIGPQVARAMFDMNLMAFTFIWIPIAVFVAGVSMAGMRSKAMPSWLWGSGAIYSLIAVVASAGVFAHSGGFAPGGGLQLVVFILFAVWALVLSLWLWTRMGTETGSQAAAAEKPMAMTS
jgi:hypothetical protein